MRFAVGLKSDIEHQIHNPTANLNDCICISTHRTKSDDSATAAGLAEVDLYIELVIHKGSCPIYNKVALYKDLVAYKENP